MVDKWMKAPDFEATFRENLRRLCVRKQVLAIFDGLVLNEHGRLRISNSSVSASPPPTEAYWYSCIPPQ
jgi:hypothetical protein